MKKSLFITFLLFLIFTTTANAEKIIGKELELQFSFGNRTGIYTGNIENGLPNDFGRFEGKNIDGVNWYYEGNFVDGHFDGKGIAIWGENETKLEGTYKNDALNGYGKKYINGTLIYEGEWVDGENSGEGKAYNGNETWIGTFKKGSLNGQATYYVDNKVRASGEWKNGVFWNGKEYNEAGEWTEIKNGNKNNSIIIIFLLSFFGILIGLPILATILFKYAIKPAVIKIKHQDDVVKCPNCGAQNKIVGGKVGECEYCGSPIN